MPVTVDKSRFGTTADGADVDLYTLRSTTGGGGCGLEVRVCTWGATTVSVLTPDRSGHVQDITLNHRDLGGIQEQTAYYGATVGRVASTISNARCV